MYNKPNRRNPQRKNQMKILVEYLKKREDPRKEKGKRHPFLPTLIIMIMGMLSGQTGLRAIARFGKANREILKEHLYQEEKRPRSQHAIELAKG